MASEAIAFRLHFAVVPDDLEMQVNRGSVTIEKESGSDAFCCSWNGPSLRAGPPAAVIKVLGDFSFSFFIRDVRPRRPICFPEYGVAIVHSCDSVASLATIQANAIRETEPVPECDLETAYKACEGMVCPVWLGLGGDARTFLASFAEDHGCWGWITPWMFHHRIERDDGYKVEWDFTVGRGSPYRHEIQRRLVEGMLPMIDSDQIEGSIAYRVQLFASADSGNLQNNPPRGTEWRAAYMSTMGCMYPSDKLEEMAEHYRSAVSDRVDRPVCCLRVQARNDGKVPAYAYYRAPAYKPNGLPPMYPAFARPNDALEWDPETGFCHEGDAVFSVNRMNKGGLPNEEMAVLLEPGESVAFECLLPFKPVSVETAQQLSTRDFDELEDDCKAYWKARLQAFARWQLPELPLDQRLRAGNQHLLMNTLGERFREGTPLLSTAGVYAPIGTESTPAIQHLSASGCLETAARCLDYFFALQRDDGYIQSFNYYDSETGPVLANIWNQYCVSGDLKWLRSRAEGIRKAARYLVDRRRKTIERDGLQHVASGMLSGKIADPDEYFHQFSLNADAVKGLRGAAAALQVLEDPYSEVVSEAAESLAESTRQGFFRAFADAPLVPCADGSWAPLVSAWPGPRGDVTLYADRGRWFTHGSFHIRSQMALTLVHCGVLSAEDSRVTALVRADEAHVLCDFTSPSQPYRQRLDYYYAATGQTARFTQLFYRQLARLQDRETYTFWEHYYRLSSQKIHEEAWFLRQLSWMLAFEEGGGLTLLKVAPKSWFEAGKILQVDAMYTVFGRLSLKMESTSCGLIFEVDLQAGPVREASRLGIRLPAAPLGSATTGSWDESRQILELDPPFGKRRFVVQLDS